MITISNVVKGFGGRTLFENVNVAFRPGVRYGLTGPNGAGKTTFMKMLIGAEEPDGGGIQRPKRTAWLRQDHSAFDEHKALDTVIMGNARLAEAMRAKEEIYARGEFTDEDNEALGELECVVAEENGYVAEADAATLLVGTGVPQDLHDRPMSELQGDMKLRVLLAQALFGDPEALLLDEPTNHLDLDAIRWLQDHLLAFQGVLVVISHDRRFLNEVCDRIADIDFETIIEYAGNYDDMVRQKAQIRGRIEKETAAKEKKIEQLQDFLQRFGAGSRASQARSRAKEIEKLRPDEIKRSNIVRPYIRFDEGDASGRDVLEVRGLSFAYEEGAPIFTDLHTRVGRGEKVAIVGGSGLGKTTLCKVLVGRMAPTEGSLVWGHNVRVGYFAEHHRDEIEPGHTVFSWLHAQRPEMDHQDVRAILGRMLFSGEDGAKPTATLSGGEAARLMFCKLIIKRYNVLVLDEPTNHLDLESISALREAIEAFPGTIFYVTHDRDLADAASRILAYPERGTLLDYTGNMEEYLTWYDKHHERARHAS
ncbi:MAG: ABC-F family ATP-binding cassette domain-containing protein [Alphaproteobacteria bacterium]|nr:ABC-F family ATP-binding cassette domain-containing protein [Alphaproteobacteria bacterium]